MHVHFRKLAWGAVHKLSYYTILLAAQGQKDLSSYRLPQLAKKQNGYLHDTWSMAVVYRRNGCGWSLNPPT